MLLFLINVVGKEFVKFYGIRDHMDIFIHTTVIFDVLAAFFGRPGDNGRFLCKVAEITVGDPGHHVDQLLRRNVVVVVIVHGMQGVDQRDVERFCDMDAGKADAEFVMNVDDVRSKLFQQLDPLVGIRGGQPVIIKPFGAGSGAVKNVIFDVMMLGVRVCGNDQNLMS